MRFLSFIYMKISRLFIYLFIINVDLPPPKKQHDNLKYDSKSVLRAYSFEQTLFI